MTTPSNLYAEKVFAEHPISLWPLDDRVDYVSLISENQRNINSEFWQVSGASSVGNEVVFGTPFPDSITSKIAGEFVESEQIESFSIDCLSSNIFRFSQLNQDMGTVSIGTYVFSKSLYVNSYQIGYAYWPDGQAAPTIVSKKFASTISNQWVFISDTFQIPQELQNTDIRLFLSIEYINAGNQDSDYEFFVNGITVGQWSEEFNATSLGIEPDPIPTDIVSSVGDTDVLVSQARSYGLQDASGYYFVQDKKILAKNHGVPLVFGSDNVTRIYPRPNSKPSLILPGFGFLNDWGRYQEATLEMWLRVDSQATSAKRIFGPVSSEDGVYLDGPFVKIKIGPNSASHYLGEWFRPILLNLRIKPNLASLLINGEEVISMQIDMPSIQLPEQLDSNGKSQDWIGFYAYDDVRLVEVDCVSIYPYWVSDIVAKRRWAYGQAVEIPENANTSFGGTTVAIDYSVADYTNNYTYPEFGKFAQGIVENLDVSRNTIELPSYVIPEIRFLEPTDNIQSWYAEQDELQDDGRPFFTFEGKESFMFIDKINFMQQKTSAIYGIFSIEEYSTSEQILFKIENVNNSNYFSVSIIGDRINYNLFYNGNLERLYSDSIIDATSIFAGINLDGLVRAFGGNVSAFFGNRSQLRIYIVGDSDFSKTFQGKIYKIGFCTTNNFKKLSSLFTFSTQPEIPEIWDVGDSYFGNDPAFWNMVIDAGRVDSFQNDGDSTQQIYDHVASYTLRPIYKFGEYSLDISVSSSWQDYLPLNYFAQFVDDSFGNKYYDLDFLQFNSSVPALPGMGNLVSDTKQYSIRQYITFQFLRNGANANLESFTQTVSPVNGVIDAGNSLDWINTKYLVENGTIIYPPSSASVSSLAIVTHIEIEAEGISANPIKIRRLEYASQAINEISPNFIGTKFGTKIIPYKKYGSYFDYVSRNPFRIYKGTTPHLYLTKDSGIQKVGSDSALVDRGLILQINQNLAESYKVFAMQMFIRFPDSEFSQTPRLIFEVQGKEDFIKFFAVASDASGRRGRLYGINAKTGTIENGLLFYINGKKVRDAVIDAQDWAVIGINFARILDFDNYPGAIRILSGAIINNVSHYQSTSLQEIQRQLYRPWFRVRQIGLQEDGQSLNWVYWQGGFTWNGVLVANEVKLFGFDPSDVYKRYTGTNKFIIDDEVNSSVFRGYGYSVYRNVEWNSSVIKPL
jgi:hypothetical protein